MHICRFISVTFFAVTLNMSVVYSQQDSSAQGVKEFSLTIGGEVEHPLTMTLGDLKKLPHQTIHIEDRDGKDGAYSGVPLLELFHRAGATLGKNLRGKALTSYVLVEASNNYQVAFALAEVDTEFANQLILLADEKDNQPLSKTDGPLQLIVPKEKRHARWVRQVQSVMIRRP